MSVEGNVKERPILFSGEMVRAILDGRKTQTRRPIVQVRGIGRVSEFQATDTPGYDFKMRDREARWHDLRAGDLLTRCPYGKPGDRLWVRETWGAWPGMAGPIQFDTVRYRADGEYQNEAGAWRWRSSIHMPRRIARVVLEVTALRVQRLGDITEEDARAEGVPWGEVECPGGWMTLDARAEFMLIWDRLHGKHPGMGVDDNPWVWVIEFKRV